MDYPKEQLKGEDWIGFQRSKSGDILNITLMLFLLAICVIFPVSKLISAANYQQSMTAVCATLPVQDKFLATPCDTSSGSSGITGSDSCLIALAVGGFIVLLVLLVQAIRRLRQTGLYIFDRPSNSFSLDDKELAHLSDIREIKVSQSHSAFALDVVYADDNNERLSTFRSSGDANDAADQIATFLGVPKTHGMGFF